MFSVGTNRLESGETRWGFDSAHIAKKIAFERDLPEGIDVRICHNGETNWFRVAPGGARKSGVLPAFAIGRSRNRISVWVRRGDFLRPEEAREFAAQLVAAAEDIENNLID